MITPVTHYTKSGSEAEKLAGDKLLSEGVMGTIILAGGMGTRLGFPHPKGTYPISVVKQKSLFQLFAEKTLAASQKANKDLLLAVMTSPENDQETRNFFSKNKLFGLKPSQLTFFSQSETVLEDEEGNSLDIKASDGNGSVFESFTASGIYDVWQQQNINYINIILVDNALADPFDANLLGSHVGSGADVTLKCVERNAPDERVGLLVKKNEKLAVVEYSEISPEISEALDEKGYLKYPLANISLFCISSSFFKQLAQEVFPWHRARKPISAEAGSPVAIKKERFIFDLLNFSHKIHVVIYPRNVCFAPLKNKTGTDSVESVKNLLESYDRDVLSNIIKKPILNHPLEIAAQFHYPTEALKALWHTKELSKDDHYIS